MAEVKSDRGTWTPLAAGSAKEAFCLDTRAKIAIRSSLVVATSLFPRSNSIVQENGLIRRTYCLYLPTKREHGEQKALQEAA